MVCGVLGCLLRSEPALSANLSWVTDQSQSLVSVVFDSRKGCCAVYSALGHPFWSKHALGPQIYLRLLNKSLQSGFSVFDGGRRLWCGVQWKTALQMVGISLLLALRESQRIFGVARECSFRLFLLAYPP